MTLTWKDQRKWRESLARLSGSPGSIWSWTLLQRHLSHSLVQSNVSHIYRCWKFNNASCSFLFMHFMMYFFPVCPSLRLTVLLLTFSCVFFCVNIELVKWKRVISTSTEDNSSELLNHGVIIMWVTSRHNKSWKLLSHECELLTV